MKNKILYLIVAGIVLYIVFFAILPRLGDRYKGCNLHHDVYVQSIRSRVLKKFVDSSNHYDQVIVYSGQDKEPHIMSFTPEFLDMFDRINPGDSIIKEKKLNRLQSDIQNYWKRYNIQV